MSNIINWKFLRQGLVGMIMLVALFPIVVIISVVTKPWAGFASRPQTGGPAVQHSLQPDKISYPADPAP